MPFTSPTLGCSALDHIAGRNLALVQRLQRDLDAAGVQRRVGAVDADE